MEKMENLYTVGGNVNSYSLMKNSMKLPQKIFKKMNYHMIKQFQSWVHIQRNWNQYLKEICTPMFNAALFTIAKIWKQHKCPSMNTWIKKMWVIYIDIFILYNGILFSHEKKGNPAICNNMDISWGHYAKWDNSDRERQVLYDITYMWNLKNRTCKKPESRMEVIGGRELENWGDVVYRYNLATSR